MLLHPHLCLSAIAWEMWVTNLNRNIHSWGVMKTIKAQNNKSELLKTTSMTHYTYVVESHTGSYVGQRPKGPLFGAAIRDINTCVENLEPDASLNTAESTEQCLIRIQWWGKSSPRFPLDTVHASRMTTKWPLTDAVCVCVCDLQWEPQRATNQTTAILTHTLLLWHCLCLGLNVTFNSCTIISSCVDTLEEETRKHSAAI